MNDDELLLLFSFLLYWVTFAFLVIKTAYKKRIIIVNLTIHTIYSLYFLYGLFYQTQGNGTALAWWFYLLLVLWTHWLIILVQLIRVFLKQKK
jgi:hypothetical protein